MQFSIVAGDGAGAMADPHGSPSTSMTTRITSTEPATSPR